jgi:hypothetical protein
MVFWESLPEVYRLQDENYGGVLEQFSDGIRPSFDLVKAKADSYFDLRYPLACRTQYDEVVPLRLGKQIIQLGELEQRGLDGTVDTIRQFSSLVGRFRSEDVGKELILVGSSIESNNTRVFVARVINPNTVLTDPMLAQDVGPLRWELRPHLEVSSDHITVQVQSGYVDQIFPGWKISDGRGEYEVVARRHFPADRQAKQLFTEQEGQDGYLTSTGTFKSPTALFFPKDIGKKLVLTGSSVEGNDGVYEILSIIAGSPQAIELDSTTLVTDPGPLYWALLPRPELDVVARVPFRGVADQDGVDGELTLPSTLQADTAAFVSDDVGRWVSIRGSQLGNDGLFEILSVVTPTEVTLDTAFAAPESSLVWEVRDYTGIGDTVQVQANAPSIIEYLAQDFGITIDRRENEDKQRKWVYNVSGWTNIKGTENGYIYVGRLAGFDVTVQRLFRITLPIYNVIIALGFEAAVVEYGEPDPGRYGLDGKLTSLGGSIFFSSDTAQFHAYDAGRQLLIGNAGTPGNNGLYTIGSVISSTEVEFDASASATTPDYGSGGTLVDPTIRWSILRLYTTQPPMLPKYDDFVHSLMKEIINWKGIGEFDIDKFCWEADWDADIPIDLISVTSLAVSLWTVVVQTPAGQPGSADAIAGVGQWQFLDTDGNEYYLQDVPVDIGGGQFSFTVNALLAPTMGGPEDPILRYTCSEALSCEFCASNKILITLEVGPELATATGAEVENLLQRALDRMEQAKPVHVEFVVLFRSTHDALLTLTAEVETHPDIEAFLTAYLVWHFDDIEGDALEADHGLYGSVEPIIK